VSIAFRRWTKPTVRRLVSGEGAVYRTLTHALPD
jgi:hypothetical protein